MLDIDHIHFQTVCDNQTVLVAYKYETYPEINFDAENILGFWSSEETPTIEEMPFVVQSFYEAIRSVDATDRLVIYDFYEGCEVPQVRWLIDNIDPMSSGDE